MARAAGVANSLGSRLKKTERTRPRSGRSSASRRRRPRVIVLAAIRRGYPGPPAAEPPPVTTLTGEEYARAVDVQTIADGLRRWTALHPDWTPKADWDEEVASFYVESEGDVVLVDPLVPDDDRDRKRFLDALDRDVERAGAPAIVLTVFWHERSATELAERYAGATVWSYAPTLDRLEGNVTNPFTVADPLPGGIRAIDADGEEAVLWIPSHHALAVGDVLARGRGGRRPRRARRLVRGGNRPAGVARRDATAPRAPDRADPRRPRAARARGRAHEARGRARLARPTPRAPARRRSPRRRAAPRRPPPWSAARPPRSSCAAPVRSGLRHAGVEPR